MTIYHIHHIVPKHMGGTDDPSNLTRISVEEHAAAHLELYQKFGKWQDLCAYKVLSYEITQPEAVAMAKREAGRAGGIAARGKRKGMKFCVKSGHPYTLDPSRSPITKKIECPYCNRSIDRGNYARYHGDRCKMK
jgi:hypothetical protein